MGQYDNGLRVGVWTRFFSTGEVRAQAEFREGMQHGWVLAFNKLGERTRSARYQDGSPVLEQ
jgi:antitoxin component YwqK of YwqJK toxin-antitoxin module